MERTSQSLSISSDLEGLKKPVSAAAAEPKREAGGNRAVKRLRRELSTLARLKRVRLNFWTGAARLLPPMTLPSVRAQLYRLAGCRIAPGVALLGCPILIGEGDVASRLHVGEGSIIGMNVTIGLDAEVRLGRQVSVSPNVTLCTASHAIGFGSRRMNPKVSAKPIIVGDGAWVGMQSFILPGVTLGQGSVVSAGSVVTESVPANSLAAGNPAKVLQTLHFGDR